MTDWITNEIIDLIRETRRRVPMSWKIQTIETEGYLILHIDMKMFEEYTIHDKIRIAEATNQLCESIKRTGCPCVIQKA